MVTSQEIEQGKYVSEDKLSASHPCIIIILSIKMTLNMRHLP
jgi:hypothetical protein